MFEYKIRKQFTLGYVRKIKTNIKKLMKLGKLFIFVIDVNTD